MTPPKEELVLDEKAFNDAMEVYWQPHETPDASVKAAIRAYLSHTQALQVTEEMYRALGNICHNYGDHDWSEREKEFIGAGFKALERYKAALASSSPGGGR